MLLIVGLGNPGEKYRKTRHNVGFLVLDRLAELMETSFRSNTELEAEFVEMNVDGEKVLLAKPSTFMNHSGRSVQKIAQTFGVESDAIWVVYDDVALPFGAVRIRQGGSAGGHNGIRSLLEYLPDENFTRIRVGVGAPPEQMELSAWVLSPFSKEEQEQLPRIVEEVSEKLFRAIPNQNLETTTETF